MANTKHFNNNRVYLPELLKALNDTGPNQRAKRIELIREFASKGSDHQALLRAFIECLWHPDVVFDLPPGIPPFKENEAPDYDMAGRSLFNFFKERMPTYFVKGQRNHIQIDVKRQQLFIIQLESLHKDEARLLCNLKDKELRACKKFVNEDLFREACPGWLPELPKDQSANG